MPKGIEFFTLGNLPEFTYVNLSSSKYTCNNVQILTVVEDNIAWLYYPSRDELFPDAERYFLFITNSNIQMKHPSPLSPLLYEIF